MSSTIAEQEVAEVESDPYDALPFEVLISNGDSAKADSPEAIRLAARTLIDDAHNASGNYYAKFTATFLHQGVCVLADVRETSI